MSLLFLSLYSSCISFIRLHLAPDFNFCFLNKAGKWASKKEWLTGMKIGISSKMKVCHKLILKRSVQDSCEIRNSTSSSQTIISISFLVYRIYIATSC